MTYYKYDNNLINAKDRFDKKYEKKDSGCWEWTQSCDVDGYGSFCINVEKKKRSLRAHRYSWIIANKQDWPLNMPVARHLCNNPSCVNPEHIVPGTIKENVEDAIMAGTHYNGANAKKRPVRTPNGDFESGVIASKSLGIRHPELIKRLKIDPDYSYL